MKIKYFYSTLALLLGLLIGTGTAWLILSQHYEERITVCKNVIEEAQEKEDTICGGYNLGDVRITEIICPPGKKEVCLCGAPKYFDLSMSK